MFTRPACLVSLLAFTLSGCAHLIWGCSYRAPLEEQVVAAQDATRVQIDVAAGSLVVVGSDDVTEVRARGEACSSDELRLDEFSIRVYQDGDTVHVESVQPDESSVDGLIDMVVDVPANLFALIGDSSGRIELSGVAGVDITDGSGSVYVEDISGNVRITDGSGSIDVRDVRGDVWVTDGSGRMDVEGVAGSVVVTEDGSGSIDIRSVEGDVTIRRDGSGSIRVRSVGGSFRVESDGSGGIDYEDVVGELSLPER